ncbi:MAG: RNA polymerase sigma factor [Actinomycetota bacterium]
MRDDRLTDELVDQIRERDEVAFSTVYQLLASDLLSFAVGMLRDRGAAEDAVQQSFLELARAAPTIRGDARSLRSWMYRSVRFSCLDEIRRRDRHPEQPVETLPEEGSLDDDLLDPELRDALMDLPVRQRSIVVLRYVVGFSVSEIADIIGTTRAGVYASSTRAERQLKKSLEAVENPRSPASVPVNPTSKKPPREEGP